MIMLIKEQTLVTLKQKYEKVVGKGNVYYVLNYIFRAGQYKKLLENIRLNKIHFSQHFIDRFEADGYLD